MEGELQELRELVSQLRADNERLRQEQAAALPAPSAAPSTSAVPPTASSTASDPPSQRGWCLCLEKENVPCLGEEQVEV